MKKPREPGFSLIEVMIVVIIMALIMGGVGLSIGATSRVKLRSSCVTLMAAVRYAFSRAVTQGTTVRLVLDFEGRTMHLEEATGRVVLNRADETGEGLKRSADEEQEREEIEEQRNSFLNLSGTSSSGSSSSMGSGMGMGGGLDGIGGMGGMSGLGMLGGGLSGDSQDAFGEGLVMDDAFYASLDSSFRGNPLGYEPPTFKALPGKRGKPRPLEGDTIFKRVFTPHEYGEREDGRAYIYFFPTGLGEHAFVQLSDGEDRIYTVETHPLSGKSYFYNEEREPEEELDELEDADE